jgi:hypothetical protein
MNQYCRFFLHLFFILGPDQYHQTWLHLFYINQRKIKHKSRITLANSWKLIFDLIMCHLNEEKNRNGEFLNPVQDNN